MASRQASIRAKCEDCSAEDTTAIRCCPVVYCSLWPYRIGYTTTRNNLYYTRTLYLKHRDVPQEQFNQVLKRAQLSA